MLGEMLMSKNENIIVGPPLIKITTRDRVKSLLQGKIYMKSLKWYREHEAANNDTVVGDEFDGVLYFTDATFTILNTCETAEIKNSAMKTNYSDDFAFCMFSVYPNSATFKFSEEQKKELLTFGDTTLLITNTYEFVKRMSISAEKLGLTLYQGKVNYYNPNIDNGNKIISLLAGMHNVAFWKRDSYSLQQEYRFLLHSVKTDGDFFILDIGDISDISVVMDTTTMLKAEIKPHK